MNRLQRERGLSDILLRQMNVSTGNNLKNYIYIYRERGGWSRESGRTVLS